MRSTSFINQDCEDTMMRTLTPICLLLVSGACTSTPVVEDRPVTVQVPVSQPCATARPARVTPLRDTVPPDQWKQRDVRQKAAAVSAQGLAHQQYGEDLAAATGACP